MKQNMRFKKFAARLASWESVFSEAAEFATSIGPELVVSISHSCDHHTAIVTVWYWSQPGFEAPTRQ